MTATQTTQIEQARAVAEVAALVRAAQDMPRDEERCRLRFLAACGRPAFAERAFFRLPRGGKPTTGPTIAFALEAARCWGNVTSGSVELARYADRSEMLAFAWDLETSYQRRITFVSPHVGYADSPKFGEDGSPLPVRRLTVPRDVRESNQSTASRVEREAILAVLPAWYVEEGVARCYATINGDGSITIEDQRRKAIDLFESEGIALARVEAKIGVPASEWRMPDLAVLRVIVSEIARGEKTYEDEFPQPRPTGRPRSTTDLMNSLNPDQGGAQPAGVDTPDTEADAARSTVNAIFARMAELGLGGRSAEVRDRRHRLLALLVGRETDGSAANPLKVSEGNAVRQFLTDATAEDVAALLDPEQPADDGSDADR